jgi:hypothetical protein
LQLGMVYDANQCDLTALIRVDQACVAIQMTFPQPIKPADQSVVGESFWEFSGRSVSLALKEDLKPIIDLWKALKEFVEACLEFGGAYKRRLARRRRAPGHGSYRRRIALIISLADIGSSMMGARAALSTLATPSSR